jgi:hypothetical protein
MLWLLLLSLLLLQDALDRIMAGRTSVVVAHRLSTDCCCVYAAAAAGCA